MREGTTLVELIATLAILGLVAGIGAVTLGGWRRAGADETADLLAAARARAIGTGTRVRVDRPGGESVLFLPDGRALGGGLDPLTGAVPDASR
jgi:prepilin-type N-terminal cleavage/methylation domain-containing protein